MLSHIDTLYFLYGEYKDSPISNEMKRETLLTKLYFCIVGGGRPRVRIKFPTKTLNKSNLNWVHGFHKVLEALSGFCL